MIDKPIVHEDLIKIKEDYIALTSPIPLYTLSSAVLGAGFGHYKTFINRHVDKDYAALNPSFDLKKFIERKGFAVDETIGMMTAAKISNVSYKLYEADAFSLLVVVTAGVGNAVDCTKSYRYMRKEEQNTINTWLFINGRLTDEAIVQSIITATEAKTKALKDLHIVDPVSKTIATGTSTDSILVANTQKGTTIEYAGSIAPLGQLIGIAVYTETKKAIENSMSD